MDVVYREAEQERDNLVRSIRWIVSMYQEEEQLIGWRKEYYTHCMPRMDVEYWEAEQDRDTVARSGE